MATNSLQIVVFLILLTLQQLSCFSYRSSIVKTKGYSNVALRAVSTPVEPKVSLSIDQKTPSDWDKVKEVIEEAKASKKPPIYQPGSYIEKAIAASAYLIPLVDATDLGKYMFEAYPDTGLIYNSIFGPISGVYNGVPFLSFAVFFIMSYISRAPSFPVEIRFHFAQAFMIALVQFVPTLLLGALEKAGVPGLAILYNTVFLWVVSSCVSMQSVLLNPITPTKNPFLINVVGWSMSFMNYTPDMAPKN